MALLTYIFVFGLGVIFTECTFHQQGIHHGMMGMPMYGHYMYPGMGMGMGMGMHQAGPMMYGMSPGFMPFKDVADTEASSTENPEKISLEKKESGNPKLIPFQEQIDPDSPRMVRKTLEKLNIFKNTEMESSKLSEENSRYLFKREIAKSDDKNTLDLVSDLPIIFPDFVDDASVKLKETNVNDITESSIHVERVDEATEKSVSKEDIPALVRNSDYVMIPVVQAVSPVLFDNYANQRDSQTPLAVNSQSINQGIVPNLNNYQHNIQNQIPMYRNEINNMNGVGQNYNMVPVNNIGNTPGVVTLLTLPNNMGDQTGNMQNNQYYVNSVPQNIVNRAGLQNLPSYNVAPTNPQQHNMIRFLVQPNTMPFNNQHSNNFPINNQLVNMLPINNNLNNILPVGNYVPANSYILVNSPQNVGPLPNQAGLNAWNVPIGNQLQNYNLQQQPLNQQPNNIPTGNDQDQGNLVLNRNIAVTGEAQPLNVDSNYVPVYNTKDEVDGNEINS